MRRPTIGGRLTRFFRRNPAVLRVLSGLYELVRDPSPPIDSLRGLLDRFSRSRPGVVTFLQIGSSDGSAGDPLREFILRDKWQGVLVEPVPYVFQRLRANYQGTEDRLIFINAAVTAREGTSTFYCMRERDGAAPAWYHQLGSFDREVICSHRRLLPDIEKDIVAMEVACLTVSGLVSRHCAGGIDLLHVDTEGLDAEILMSVDFSTIRPAVLIFENRHLSRTTFRECRRHLSAAGYRLFSAGLDTVAIRADESALPVPTVSHRSVQAA